MRLDSDSQEAIDSG